MPTSSAIVRLGFIFQHLVGWCGWGRKTQGNVLSSLFWHLLVWKHRPPSEPHKAPGKNKRGKKRRQKQEPFSWGLHLVKEGRGWVGYSGSLSQLLRLLERSMKRGGWSGYISKREKGSRVGGAFSALDLTGASFQDGRNAGMVLLCSHFFLRSPWSMFSLCV